MVRFFVARLPERPNLEDLEKQSDDLLGQYRESNPAASLEDAQLSLAREYGLPDWSALKNNVDWRNTRFSAAREHAVPYWLHAVYGHQEDQPKPEAAGRILAENPGFVQNDLFLACAAGEESVVREAIAADPTCVNRTPAGWRCPGCKKMIAMPPLVAVTHSTLLQLPEYRDRLRRCARMLLDAGADPNQSYMEGDHPLSALYGASGKNHDAEITKMLLDAGANPNDGESLYHSIESLDPTCTRLLLEAGADVAQAHAIAHQLDRDDIAGLKLILKYAKGVDDASFLWAIRRARSREHVELLLAAGANPRAKTKDGIGAYRYALQFGLRDVAELLASVGAGETLTLEDQFVAACARADGAEARRILFEQPNIIALLSELQLRQLPELMEARNKPAVRLMVELGWPIAVQGGDWKASALNLAVYQGDPEMTRFLLEHGSNWAEEHGFGDNANGTLSWASRNQPPECGDWVGCARTLVDHGMPILELDGQYSEEVEQFLAAERAKRV
jgi:ankyrin repeat protein